MFSENNNDDDDAFVVCTAECHHEEVGKGHALRLGGRRLGCGERLNLAARISRVLSTLRRLKNLP